MRTKKKTDTLITLCLISPCYNEEQVLPIAYKLFTDKLEQLIKKGLAIRVEFCS